MSKNPIVLVAVVLVVGLGVWLFASRVEDRPGDMTPLQPSPGESLRTQGTPPPPAVANPSDVLTRLQAETVLQPGDIALRELLKKALDAKEQPTWRSMIDVPYGDNAGQQIRDEIRNWLVRKMAGLGFTEAAGRPTVLIHVRADPAPEGKYTVQVVLRAAGEPRLDEKYDLPAAYKPDRLDTAFARSFAAPAIVAAAAAPVPASEKKP